LVKVSITPVNADRAEQDNNKPSKVEMDYHGYEIDKDEAPDQVARREAVEEAGLELGELWPITRYFPSPGGSDERVHLYIGRCDSEGVDGVFGLAEEGEDIRVHVWSLQEALRAISDGRIDNAASIIALQWLALNREQVRGEWA
jgi:ADP-ribose pyrophosphatase